MQRDKGVVRARRAESAVRWCWRNYSYPVSLDDVRYSITFLIRLDNFATFEPYNNNIIFSENKFFHTTSLYTSHVYILNDHHNDHHLWRTKIRIIALWIYTTAQQITRIYYISKIHDEVAPALVGSELSRPIRSSPLCCSTRDLPVRGARPPARAQACSVPTLWYVCSLSLASSQAPFFDLPAVCVLAFWWAIFFLFFRGLKGVDFRVGSLFVEEIKRI